MIPSIIIYGLVNSVSLALIAMGFSLTFGISGVANFAYGGFYLLSGFLVWMLLNYLKFPFILAIVATIGVVGLLGFVTYWVILLRVRGIPLSEVIATFALGVGILELFRWLGFVTYYLKDWGASDRTNELVETYLPNNPAVIYNRATTLMELQQYEPAIERLDRVVQLNPQNYGAQLNLYWSYRNAGNKEKASERLQAMLQLFPADAAVRQLSANPM